MINLESLQHYNDGRYTNPPDHPTEHEELRCECGDPMEEHESGLCIDCRERLLQKKGESDGTTD